MIALVRGVILAYIAGVDIERAVNLRENRQSAGKDDGVVIGVPRPRGENHLVARPDFEGG